MRKGYTVTARETTKPVHKLNAYTWAGRRAECAVTSEGLNDTDDWNKVTCPECLAARRGRVVTTARETTLGALTAADLGKRIECGIRSGVLAEVLFTGRRRVVCYGPDRKWVALGRVTTPVLVYDEEEV